MYTPERAYLDKSLEQKGAKKKKTFEAKFGLSKKREDKDFIDFLVLLAKKYILTLFQEIVLTLLDSR